MRFCWDVAKQVQSSMKLTRFCSKLIYGNLHFRILTRYWYLEIHLMITKVICTVLIEKKNKEDSLDGEKGSSGTKCCLGKIEKLAVPSRVALLQSTNIWLAKLGASVHCINGRCRDCNIHEGSGTGTVDAHGEAMIASSIMESAGTWCNKFVKEQLKAMLKDVQYNPKSNFNLFRIGKAIKQSWKLSGNQEHLVLMKVSAKLVFDIKIITKNGVIFCVYLERENEISAILVSTGMKISIEQAHIMTTHHNEE